MRHYELKDADWTRLAPLLPGKVGDAVRSTADNRLFVNTVLWIARSGAPWRDLPERFGPWNSVYRRFRRWAQKGIWQRVFEAIQDPDLDWAMLDSTSIRAHQHAAAKKSAAPAEALSRSRGGFTSKLHAVGDALGNPLRLALTPGQQADCTVAADLLEGLAVGAVLADKAYDTNALIAQIHQVGAAVVVPSKRSRRTARELDRNLYADRNKVERFFNRLKHYRRLATRYDKTATSFLAFAHCAATCVWLL
ncbi:IS5 family transposase [Hymenobacter sp. ASUV-10]|uniref:IS5 family transposase n=1 Tax=Hymenobacter aranciens TaxID=3063996 RepID=A0ABT9BAN7_9BACT|nr:IS5 family transposase [Hymenobacter sp. ASUV-10]MDO7874749.1 IS5 family transposase [Hymenobacter sp. ASUV-10]